MDFCSMDKEVEKDEIFVFRDQVLTKFQKWYKFEIFSKLAQKFQNHIVFAKEQRKMPTDADAFVSFHIDMLCQFRKW